jgi:hypothetical protein
VRIDFEEGRARFLRPDEQNHPEWGTVIPLSGNVLSPTVIAALGNLQGIPLFVDSGYTDFHTAGFLSSAVIDQLNHNPQLQTGTNQTVIGATGAGNNFRNVSMIRMSLGTLTVQNLTFGEEKYSSGLGVGFLANYVVTFDLSHHRLYLRPQERQIHWPRWYMTGMFLRKQGERLVVATVVSGRPAATAGIQPGDVLLSIDHADAGDLQVWQAAKLLMGSQTRRVNLTMDRSGHQYNVSIDLVLMRSVE